MTCQDLAQLVTDYLDGAMSAADRATFERHLSVCPDCVRFVRQMRAAVEAVGRLPPEPIAPEVEGKLLELFRDWRRGGAH